VSRVSTTSTSSYAVRIWAIRKYEGSRATTYNVRWRAGHKSHSRTYGTHKAAESFRAELITAHRKGEPFDIETGLPPSMQAAQAEITWLAHAADFVDHKWREASARHRKGIAEALTSITVVLWDRTRTHLATSCDRPCTPGPSTRPLAQDRWTAPRLLKSSRAPWPGWQGTRCP
jgi:hypothetical protein